MTGYQQLPGGAIARWHPGASDRSGKFSLPNPAQKDESGQWFFETAAGKEEIVRRRIGHNELAVIDVCGALADAPAHYSAMTGSTKQFAVKFISDPGKQNGLYWDSPEVTQKVSRAVGGLCNLRRV